MTKEEVYETLCQMRGELRERHRLPLAIPYTDLLVRCGVTRGELNGMLNELFVEGRIRVQRGLNDKLIAIG